MQWLPCSSLLRPSTKPNILVAVTSVSILLSAKCASLGQVAGWTQLGIAAAELREITFGLEREAPDHGST